MNKILIFTEYYYPGYKAGGPIQSVLNIANALENNFETYVICRDRDSFEVKSFENIKVNTWNRLNNHNVYYASPENCNKDHIKNLIAQINPNVIYLNSFFSRFSSIIFKLATSKFIRCNILIAPRGEFNTAALRIKRPKKIAYLLLFKILFLFNKNLFWHATSDVEEARIKLIMGRRTNVSLIPGLGKMKQLPQSILSKSAGIISIVTVARVHRIKNLHFFLEVLEKCDSSSRILWDIYGLIEDKEYHDELLMRAGKLDNLVLNFRGSINNSLMLETIGKYHIFALPTLGENFGHAIYDAILAGLPIIISNNTPWSNLDDKGVGFDISLDNKQLWNEKMTILINMEDSIYKEYRTNVYRYGSDLINNNETILKYINLISKISI